MVVEVEVEVTNADEGKAKRYGEMGVRELWRLDGRIGVRKRRAEFLALSPGSTPRRLDASEVLEAFTPEDVCEAVQGVRADPTPEDRQGDRGPNRTPARYRTGTRRRTTILRDCHVTGGRRFMRDDILV